MGKEVEIVVTLMHIRHLRWSKDHLASKKAASSIGFEILKTMGNKESMTMYRKDEEM